MLTPHLNQLAELPLAPTLASSYLGWNLDRADDLQIMSRKMKGHPTKDDSLKTCFKGFPDIVLEEMLPTLFSIGLKWLPEIALFPSNRGKESIYKNLQNVYYKTWG